MSTPIEFPSREFFLALASRMREESARFRALGQIDTSFVVRLLKDAELPEDRAFRLTFEVDACERVEEGEGGAPAPDFVLEGRYGAWKRWLSALREKPGEAPSLNALLHYDDPFRVVYDDPVAYEKLFRYQATLQEFFGLAAGVEARFA